MKRLRLAFSRSGFRVGVPSLRRRARVFAAAVLVLTPGGASAEPNAAELRVRLRSHSRHELIVLGLEGTDLRLRPIDSATGEIVVPLEEARELQFVTDDSLARAQQLAFHGRGVEALAILEPLARRLVPFLAAPGSNAAPIAALYFDLLLNERRWDDARWVADRLPPSLAGGAYLPRVLQLARGLRADGRLREATRLVERLPLTDRTLELVAQLGEFADELRQLGHFSEAHALYERLRAVEPESVRPRRDLLLAYTMLRQGKPLEAQRWLTTIAEPPPASPEFPLYLLLHGELALDARDPAGALDLLSRGLVIASGASEWCSDLLAGTVTAYRAAGRNEVADTLETERSGRRSSAPPDIPAEDADRPATRKPAVLTPSTP